METDDLINVKLFHQALRNPERDPEKWNEIKIIYYILYIIYNDTESNIHVSQTVGQNKNLFTKLEKT
jgi:multisubunit Na+/H+ antiporter MnhE subunit